MPAAYPDLAGRVVLVTGGASGIGRATVAAFVRQGAKTIVIDKALPPTGIPVATVALEADLRDLTASVDTLRKAEAVTGPVEVLVNNAGNGERHAFLDVTPDYWDDRMAVNLKHYMFLAQAVIPAMRRNGGGAIVNIGSTSWMHGAIDLIAYTTAKAGIIGFTKSLAREIGGDGIRVNCVTPGWVMTDHERSQSTPERLARAQQRQCLPGEILPEDLAELVVFLSSDSARMCTGQNFIVDAGAE
jgi:NAD(P)-dependent dehydrogenase (short-subunit alcohol dehydrogenase family)